MADGRKVGACRPASDDARPNAPPGDRSDWTVIWNYICPWPPGGMDVNGRRTGAATFTVVSFLIFARLLLALAIKCAFGAFTFSPFDYSCYV